jgi:tetratricopeptide (TPR) repeat protein
MKLSYFTFSKVAIHASMLCALLSAFGCAGNDAATSALQTSVTDLSAQKYDDAYAQANSAITADPDGPTASEAYYLRGRAVEDRPKPDAVASSADLSAARADFMHALTFNPDKKLQGQIRASLGNVAYFQDDYSTAVDQLSQAYPLLTDPDTQSWTLYRLGLSQQRLGLFDDADKTFDAVQRQFANSEPANRAREHTGVRAFYVQLGAFSRQTDADQAVSSARADGLNVETAIDSAGPDLTGAASGQINGDPSRGLTIVRVGPAPTFAAAQSLKANLLPKFPGAMIVP